MFLSLLAATLVLPAASSAQDQPRDDAPRWTAHQQLVLLLNPMGAEHSFDVGLRAPLGDQDELAFHGAHVAAGAVSYVAPVYAIGGGFLEVAPFSFLVLRAELSGGGLWPIGMNGAGYYGLPSYDASVESQALAAGDGATATGWSATGSATLQGMLPVGPLRILMADELGVTRAVMGGAPFYYSMKYDLVLAREDLVLTNSAFAGVEFDAVSDLVVRVGAYDDLRHVPASGYLAHQVGPLVMLEWARPTSEIESLGVFVRGGFYTHHVTRAEEATILGGLCLTYDLGAAR